MRNYLGDVAALDDNVGRLLQRLDQLGLRDKTIVVFSSDHGSPAIPDTGKANAKPKRRHSKKPAGDEPDRAALSINLMGYNGDLQGAASTACTKAASACRSSSAGRVEFLPVEWTSSPSSAASTGCRRSVHRTSETRLVRFRRRGCFRRLAGRRIQPYEAVAMGTTASGQPGGHSQGTLESNLIPRDGGARSNCMTWPATMRKRTTSQHSSPTLSQRSPQRSSPGWRRCPKSTSKAANPRRLTGGLQPRPSSERESCVRCRGRTGLLVTARTRHEYYFLSASTRRTRVKRKPGKPPPSSLSSLPRYAPPSLTRRQSRRLEFDCIGFCSARRW